MVFTIPLSQFNIQFICKTSEYTVSSSPNSLLQDMISGVRREPGNEVTIIMQYTDPWKYRRTGNFRGHDIFVIFAVRSICENKFHKIKFQVSNVSPNNCYCRTGNFRKRKFRFCKLNFRGFYNGMHSQIYEVFKIPFRDLAPSQDETETIKQHKENC